MITRHKIYEQMRRKVGTKAYVSKLLGVNIKTLWRRETGAVRITDEMMLALMMLKSNHEKKS